MFSNSMSTYFYCGYFKHPLAGLGKKSCYEDIPILCLPNALVVSLNELCVRIFVCIHLLNAFTACILFSAFIGSLAHLKVGSHHY